jgi:hypothetical protein
LQVVKDRFACFTNNLNETLRAELGAPYEDQRELAGIKYGMKPTDAAKNPVSLADIIKGCIASGGSCGTLEDIIAKVRALRVLAA